MTQSQNKQKDYKHQEKIYIYNLLYNVKHYISYRKKGPTGPKAVRYWNGGGGVKRGHGVSFTSTVPMHKKVLTIIPRSKMCKLSKVDPDHTLSIFLCMQTIHSQFFCVCKLCQSMI